MKEFLITTNSISTGPYSGAHQAGHANIFTISYRKLCVISQSLGSHIMYACMYIERVYAYMYIVLTDHHHELSQSPSSGYEPGSLKEDKTRQTHYFFPSLSLYIYLYFFTFQTLWLDLSLVPNHVAPAPPPALAPAAMAAVDFQSLFESAYVC